MKYNFKVYQNNTEKLFFWVCLKLRVQNFKKYFFMLQEKQYGKCFKCLLYSQYYEAPINSYMLIQFTPHHTCNSIFQIKEEKFLDFNVLCVSIASLTSSFINNNLYFNVNLILENDKNYLLYGYLCLGTKYLWTFRIRKGSNSQPSQKIVKTIQRSSLKKNKLKNKNN